MMYTIRQEIDKDGVATAALWEDGSWSFSQVCAPESDPTNADAALERLAKQLAHNIKHDRATQIMLDSNRIPEPLATMIRNVKES